MNESSRIFIVSAPSGAGKTTLNRRLLADHADKVQISTSLTTRPKRPGEMEGEDYYFVSEQELRQRVQQGKMLEFAEFDGKLYGTSLDELDRIARSGKSALLEIDVQGFEQARGKLKNVTSIFILPPSFKGLWQRLEERGTDSLESRWQRLQNGCKEVSKAQDYDFFIVNDDLDEAYEELEKIIVNHQRGSINRQQGKDLCDKLKREFETASWIKDLRKELGQSPSG